MIVPENPTQADVDALLQECDIHAFLNRVIMNTSHSFWQKAMDIYWPVHFWQLFKTKFQHETRADTQPVLKLMLPLPVNEIHFNVGTTQAHGP
jgi:hypothetical protein